MSTDDAMTNGAEEGQNHTEGEMKVLVCGGRYYDDIASLCSFLDAHHAEEPITLLIHGESSGADSLAGRWATLNRIPVVSRAADWRRHGRAAGPIRNQSLIDDSKPDLVIAFPGGRGTDDMVRRATAAGIPIARAPK